jgi:hypothetical protein
VAPGTTCCSRNRLSDWARDATSARARSAPRSRFATASSRASYRGRNGYRSQRNYVSAHPRVRYRTVRRLQKPAHRGSPRPAAAAGPFRDLHAADAGSSAVRDLELMNLHLFKSAFSSTLAVVGSPTTTSCSRRRRLFTTLVPIRPLPPMTTIFILLLICLVFLFGSNCGTIAADRCQLDVEMLFRRCR